jgi:formate dehydrogenase subunit delta
MTTVERLVLMANQIALNLSAEGEAAAIAATTQHIIDFWDPRMKRLIAEHLAAGGAGLSVVARAAVERLGVVAQG